MNLKTTCKRVIREAVQCERRRWDSKNDRGFKDFSHPISGNFDVGIRVRKFLVFPRHICRFCSLQTAFHGSHFRQLNYIACLTKSPSRNNS